MSGTSRRPKERQHRLALVIDDVEDNAALISLILRRNGIDTVTGATGAQGLELAFRLRPDFVILDIQLPDMDGLEVLHRLRDSELDGDLPVIAMTSYAMAGDRQRFLAAGCTGYIEKPIDPATVMAEIEKILAGGDG